MPPVFTLPSMIAARNKKPHYGWVPGFDGSEREENALDNRNTCVVGFTFLLLLTLPRWPVFLGRRNNNTV